MDSNRSIEIIEPMIGVAKIYFFEKYERSVGFGITSIRMKSAKTSYISSLFTGLLSRLQERKVMKPLACIFCVA